MATVELTASAGEDCTVTVLVDDDTADRLAGRKLSIGSHGYAQMWDGRVMLLHRWIMNIPTGTGYRVIVDHINRNPLDCRRANLRLVTPGQSNLNRSLPARDLPRGVGRRNKRYVAQIKRGRRNRYLGSFDTAEQAAAAYEAARRAIDPPEFLPTPAA